MNAQTEPSGYQEQEQEQEQERDRAPTTEHDAAF